MQAALQCQVDWAALAARLAVPVPVALTVAAAAAAALTVAVAVTVAAAVTAAAALAVLLQVGHQQGCSLLRWLCCLCLCGPVSP